MDSATDSLPGEPCTFDKTVMVVLPGAGGEESLALAQVRGENVRKRDILPVASPNNWQNGMVE